MDATDSVSIIGTTLNGQFSTAVSSQTLGSGDAGALKIQTRQLSIKDGGAIITQTSTQGQGGGIIIDAPESIDIVGGTFTQKFSSSITSQTTGAGNAGNINITTGRFTARNGGFVATRARAGSTGNAGSLTIKASDTVEVSGRSENGAVSGVTTEVELGGTGGSGNLAITTKQLRLEQGGSLFSRSAGFGQAGNINLKIAKDLFMNDGDITAFSVQSSGGSIQINAETIRLQNRSNIFSFVLLDSGGGGSIDLTANSIIALHDSNILSFAQTGRGGNITLNTRAFFGQNYRPASVGTDLLTFIENGRVDVNANGGIPGVITFPDTTFIQNSLTGLSQMSIDTNTLLANSCIVRNQQNGTFYITGTGGLPISPGEISTYTTGTVRPAWKPGDALVEPQGVYRLSNGALVLSRECNI